MRGPILVCVVSAALAGCPDDAVQGNGQAGEQTRTVGSFAEAVVEGGLGLELSAAPGIGDEVSLVVSGDENLLSLVETVVEDGRLTVRAKQPFRTTLGLNVKGTAPALLRLGASGGSTGIAKDVAVAGTFETTVAGGSRVALSGTAGGLDALVSGGSVLAARGLTAGGVRLLDVSGGSVVDVCATGTLQANASGGSVVTYACGPAQVTPTTSGGAVVKPAE
jgi:hypothetical protein